jgi:hypothetical protein
MPARAAIRAGNGLAMQAVPTLDQLARDPSAAVGLPTSALAALHLQCTAALSAIGFAWASAGQSGQTPAENRDDRMLTVDEAAAMLRRDRRWIYRHSNLPFVRRVSRKSLLCSESGIKKWLAAKRA